MASSLSYERGCIRSVFFTHGVSAELVGLVMSAPIWFGASLPLVRISFSRVGMTKASVFPEPVMASTTTPLCCMNNGIVADWRLLKRHEIPSRLSHLKHTHTHDVRGIGRGDQVPASAVAAGDQGGTG